MRLNSATAVIALALALTACERPDRATRDLDGRDPPLRVVDTLQCPEHDGPLTRVRVAPDGLSCDYVGPRGAEVTLRLIRVSASGADSALTPIEAELQALMPGASDRIQSRAKTEADVAAQADAAAAVADQAAADADAAATVEADAASAAEEETSEVSLPGISIKSKGENATVRLPGIHVDATEDGASVRIGGVRIDADDQSGDVTTDANDQQVTVRAKDDAAEIRTTRNSADVRRTYILMDERRQDGGWELVGYEARGPESGPVVVAVVRSKHRRDGDVFDSAKSLVERNVGR